MEKLQVIDCGVLDYKETLDLQVKFWENVRDGIAANTVLLVEHPDVVTLGVRKTENKLKTPGTTLKNTGINVCTIGRGGGATAHNPGQIVMYPVINLKSVGADVPDYVRTLEQVGIELLEMLGVESERKKGFPGLWVGEKKIASIGVQIKKWITLHGMAINVQNDLRIFNHIVPCGLDGVVMTSVFEETSREWPMGEIKHKLLELCMSHWG